MALVEDQQSHCAWTAPRVLGHFGPGDDQAQRTVDLAEVAIDGAGRDVIGAPLGEPANPHGATGRSGDDQGTGGEDVVRRQNGRAGLTDARGVRQKRAGAGRKKLCTDELVG